MTTTAAPATFARVLYCRDDRGRLSPVRVTSDDPAELDRVARLYARLERAGRDREARWRARHALFTDLGVTPGAVARAPERPRSKGGYPWEGPRYSFAHYLGESAVWAGPESLWLWEVNDALKGGGRWVCRFCSHYRGDLPVQTYCLGCERSGRDLVIPRGAPRTVVRRTTDDGLKGGTEGTK